MSETCPSLLDTLQFLQFPDTSVFTSESDKEIENAVSDIQSTLSLAQTNQTGGGKKKKSTSKHPKPILYRHIL
jgi:hypothetical protein